MELLNFWGKNQKLIEKELKNWLKNKSSSLIYQAMRYSVFSGGKRLRPLLVLAAAQTCDGKTKQILPVACALELVHTYSLIHDDLPALDNDDFRRGKLSCHRKFGEAVAILTGDALLTKAFEIIAKTVEPKILAQVVKEITSACGVNGMIEGQMEDIALSPDLPRRVKAGSIKSAPQELEKIYQKKTAGLIKTCIKIGAILSKAKPKEMRALEKYGENIGLAFQISDDIIDYQQERKINKLTYAQIYGLLRAEKRVKELVAKAKKELEIFAHRRAQVLKQFADFIATRKK